MTNEYRESYSRTILLIGEENFLKLKKSNVLVVGLGGVGGYAVEQLVRAGVGNLTIVDSDIVQPSNLNRQIIALKSTLGINKTEVICKRLKDINPEINIKIKNQFIKDKLIGEILQEHEYDYVIDAIDTLKPKVKLISECLNFKIPIVSAMGAGGKKDPTLAEITDISKTHNCGLSRMVRKRLHKLGIREGFKVVFSPEYVDRDAIVYDASENKKTNVGTISYIPAIFGLMCASVVISGIIGEDL